jgi:hypothetical protein
MIQIENKYEFASIRGDDIGLFTNDGAARDLFLCDIVPGESLAISDFGTAPGTKVDFRPETEENRGRPYMRD